MRLPLALAATVLIAGCQQQQAAGPQVTDAWVRLPAVEGRPGAAYFTLHGGSEPATLLAIKAPFAVRTELHQSMKTDGGMMSMAPVKQVTVDRGGTETFAPGGYHAMLFDIGPEVRAGGTVPMTFAFADGKQIETQARVVAAGDPQPK